VGVRLCCRFAAGTHKEPRIVAHLASTVWLTSHSLIRHRLKVILVLYGQLPTVAFRCSRDPMCERLFACAATTTLEITGDQSTDRSNSTDHRFPVLSHLRCSYGSSVRPSSVSSLTADDCTFRMPSISSPDAELCLSSAPLPPPPLTSTSTLTRAPMQRRHSDVHFSRKRNSTNAW
jgi:tRNA A37 threonylcarbamoyladenosine synthetase subunit TsaC/SUA5/YrdC